MRDQPPASIVQTPENPQSHVSVNTTAASDKSPTHTPNTRPICTRPENEMVPNPKRMSGCSTRENFDMYDDPYTPVYEDLDLEPDMRSDAQSMRDQPPASIVQTPGNPQSNSFVNAAVTSNKSPFHTPNKRPLYTRPENAMVPNPKRRNEREELSDIATTSRHSGRKDKFNVNYGKYMHNMYKNKPFTTEAVTEMHRRRSLPEIDVKSFLSLAQECEEEPLVQKAVHALIPVAIKVNAVDEKLKNIPNAISSINRQLSEERRNRMKIYANKFGSPKFKAAPGSWKIPPSPYWPGCDIATVYTRLQSVPPFNRASERFNSKKFLRIFIIDIVTAAFDEPNRAFVTARVREQKNNMILLDHEQIIDFIVSTCNRAGETLYHDEDIAGKRENYRRNFARRGTEKSQSDGNNNDVAK